jgi:hypothetical protein
MNFPESQVVCHGRFDGRDHGVTIGGAASKETWVFKRMTANSFTVTVKLSGNLFYVETLTLSADGSTLTDDGHPTSVKGAMKAVYDRR